MSSDPGAWEVLLPAISAAIPNVNPATLHLLLSTTLIPSYAASMQTMENYKIPRGPLQARVWVALARKLRKLLLVGRLLVDVLAPSKRLKNLRTVTLNPDLRS